METNLTELQQTAKIIIFNIEGFHKKAEKARATNQQFFLDFQDELNKLSVMY